ncbi:tripartite tricarboxylate transporter permease [Candidatus Woesearchaeota archaeon]|nr:tripartite tricarboxylate transporter permease [Candidatus Woesearchaeota archaeon]
MFLEVIFAIFAGILCGTFTGLMPGVHINLVALLLLQAASLLLQFIHPITIAIFIVAMAVTHTFLDFVPSVFLGAPESEAAAMLPGHKMLLQGKAFDAVKLTVMGSLLCLVLSILLLPLLFPFVRFVYPLMKGYIGHILLLCTAYLIFKDKQRWWNLLIFMLSGVLGLVIFSLPVKDPLFPLLSGLFGISTLLISLRETAIIPSQHTEEGMVVEKKTVAKAVVAGTIAGSMTAFLPGLGPAQGAVLVSTFVRKLGDIGYMIMVGGLGTVNFVISLVALAVLEKARNGAVLTILEVMKVQPMGIVALALVAIVAGGFAVWISLGVTRIFARLLAKVNYRTVVLCVIILVTILVGVFSGVLGIVVLLISTAVGLVSALSSTARNHAMGCLILPVILYFLV